MNLHEIAEDEFVVLAREAQRGLRGPWGGWPEAETRPRASDRTGYPIEYKLRAQDRWAAMARYDAEYWAKQKS